jgi:hypothetical protein
VSTAITAIWDPTYDLQALQQTRYSAGEPASQEGKFELYKTSSHFDGTAHKPEVLG